MSKRIFKIIEKRNLWFSISMLFTLIGLALMPIRAFQSKPMLNYGIDFVGGTTMTFKFDELNNRHLIAKQKNQTLKEVNTAFLNDIREALTPFGLENSDIQISQDQEVIIKTVNINQAKTIQIREALFQKLGNMETLEIDAIGPSMGSELRQRSIWILLIVFVALMLYIAWRFEWTFGIAALISLLHDALTTLAFASMFNLEINSAFVAAILTVLGYSLNDTIVLFDRIRENIKLLRKNDHSLTFIANLSITQTMSRTINTTATVLLVVLCLIVLGGTTIKPFAVILFAGVVSGAYSTIFIASPTLVSLKPSTTEKKVTSSAPKA
ncbi:MAG: protein translocase subunit SecF [Candidatus Margulisiibacteriota bacterium]